MSDANPPLKPSYIQPTPRQAGEPHPSVKRRNELGLSVNCHLDVEEHNARLAMVRQRPLDVDETARLYGRADVVKHFGWAEALKRWPTP